MRLHRNHYTDYKQKINDFNGIFTVFSFLQVGLAHQLQDAERMMHFRYVGRG